MNYRNGDFPSDYEAKQAILEVGRRMYMKNFVAANDGNISCKVSEDTIWCTPTGVSKGYMTDDMLVLMDLDGNVLKGNLKPSSEVKMHLRVYKENPKMNAVVHAHPPAATSYAIAGLPLNHAILTEAVMGIGEIPIAPYAMPLAPRRCPTPSPLMSPPTTAACWPTMVRWPGARTSWRRGCAWSPLSITLWSACIPTACSVRPMS